MAREPSERRKRDLKDLWRLVLFLLGVVAVVQELRRPSDERTWHGTIAGFVPYDFRKPTIERIRETYWNPDGPFMSPKVFGVGWTPNAGAIRRVFGG